MVYYLENKNIVMQFVLLFLFLVVLWTGNPTNHHHAAGRPQPTQGSRLPITQAGLANQNVTENILCRKPKEWPPHLTHKLKHSWWVSWGFEPSPDVAFYDFLITDCVIMSIWYGFILQQRPFFVERIVIFLSGLQLILLVWELDRSMQLIYIMCDWSTNYEVYNLAMFEC